MTRNPGSAWTFLATHCRTSQRMSAAHPLRHDGQVPGASARTVSPDSAPPLAAARRPANHAGHRRRHRDPALAQALGRPSRHMEKRITRSNHGGDRPALAGRHRHGGMRTASMPMGRSGSALPWRRNLDDRAPRSICRPQKPDAPRRSRERSRWSCFPAPALLPLVSARRPCRGHRHIIFFSFLTALFP